MTTEIAIIGAGPYGLSLAASLRARGIEHRIFGSPMHTWRAHMPAGMKLKSEGFASSLYDGANDLTLRTYCAENRLNYQDTGLPVTLDLFCTYGMAFQARKVPDLEQTDVLRLDHTDGGFRLALRNGQECLARRVVIATGISHYEHVPECLAALPAGLAGHASAFRDPASLAGMRVAVAGGGASAIDMAALLAEAGAETVLVVRGKRIVFLGPPSGRRRGLIESLKAPQSGLGPGWKSRACTDAPWLFRHLPEEFRHKVVRKHLGPSAGWWTRAPVEKHVDVLLETRILGAAPSGGGIELHLAGADGTRRIESVDRVIAATGYRPDLRRLPFLSKHLRQVIGQTANIPHLSKDFETSVPGLYVTGLAAAYTFGPLLRFACGADFTARTLTRHLAQAVRKTGPARAFVPEPQVHGHPAAGAA
jgi:cation diffusion facilitator CzcD-associated flavoprotein CzcO